MLYNLIAFVGVFSLTIVFAFASYFAVGHYAAAGSAFLKWRVFTVTSAMSFLGVLGVTWIMTKLHFPSSSNALNSLSRMFSYSLFMCSLVTFVATIIGSIGFVVLWFRMRGK